MRTLAVNFLFGLVVLAAGLEAGLGQDFNTPPLSPEASLPAIKLRPGLQVELMAAEPLVKSPISFNFGPDGRLWVVEMADYPLGIDGKGKAGGRVKILEKTKGDGPYDKATLFLDGLPYPTTVLPWRKGALVIAPPDIFHAEDTTGAGMADKKEVLYTNIKRGNPQHLVNSLALGLDNWLYCANGETGGQVTSAKTGKTIDIRQRDFRIKPDTGELELQSGQSQFGRSRDDWGNWFGNYNIQPIWHYAIDEHYIGRNPYLPAPDSRSMIPLVGGSAPVFPAATILPRFNDPHTAGRITSACSPMIYRDNLFGPSFAGNMFVCEPVHNLVHREIVSPQGFTFTSRRADDEQQSEFFASTDVWCRPTTIKAGPDGALWISDMYRLVIEHPEWIPKSWQAKLDLRAGQDKGRIYRLFPQGVQPRPLPRLDKMTTAELVAALDSPSGWQRDQIQLMLIHKQEAGAHPLLEKMLSSDNPLARLHAWCTLDGLGGVTAAQVEAGLKRETHPGVRRHLIRLLEPHLNEAKLNLADLKLDRDTDPHVRMQLAYSLGEWNAHQQVGQMLGQLVLSESEDPYFLAAIFSSINKDNFAPFVSRVLGSSGKTPPIALMDKLVTLGTKLGDDKGMVALIQSINTPADGSFTAGQFAALGAYVDALDLKKQSLPKAAQQGSAELQGAVQKLRPVFEVARKKAVDTTVPVEYRQLAIRGLGRGLDDEARDRQILASLLGPQTPSELQIAAITALAKARGGDLPKIALGGWKAYGPAVRAHLLDTLLSRPEWVQPLLAALNSKTVLPAEVGAVHRQRLLLSKTEAIRFKAQKLFAEGTSADRKKLVDSYRSALAMKGDAAKGAEIFQKACAACHQLGGVGQQVGPDLAAEAAKPGETLLVAILDPNAAVEARYVSYNATTKSGVVISGLLASETGGSVTLIANDGKKHDIARADLDELVSTGKSLMPEGMEKDIAVAQMADLLAHLRKFAAPPTRKVFPGNAPALVQANADGSLNLTAANCEIYGRTLTLEKAGNLGHWQSEDDRIVWTMQVPKAAQYTIWLEWACDKANAGNTLALEVEGKRVLSIPVKATANADTYQFTKFGVVTLPAGRQTLTLRAGGQIQGNLIDLKELKLTPPPRKYSD